LCLHRIFKAERSHGEDWTERTLSTTPHKIGAHQTLKVYGDLANLGDRAQSYSQ